MSGPISASKQMPSRRPCPHVFQVERPAPELGHCVEVVAVDEHAIHCERHGVIVAAETLWRDHHFSVADFLQTHTSGLSFYCSVMGSSDAYGLGYHDVDADSHTEVLVANMDATAQWPATQRLRAWERRQLGVVEGERVLDVGCWRGEVAVSFGFDLGVTGELVGIDTSAAMLDVARRQASEVPCALRFSVGDARSLDEADHSFDVVRSERTLQWLPDPGGVVAEFVRVLRPGGRLSLIDTDWSTLILDVGDPRVTDMVTEAMRVERNRPSNVGRRLAELATAAGCDVTAETTDTQIWTRWNPDQSPAPDGFFSMQSLADDLVDKGQLEHNDVPSFVDQIHEAARRQRFNMSLTMHAVIAVPPRITTP